MGLIIIEYHNLGRKKVSTKYIMVLVSKAEKRAIFLYLLKEGVVVVKKDPYLAQHQAITDVSNLKVMMIVKSLKSQGFLNEVFNWKWSYYSVTDKGVSFLTKALGKSQLFNITI